MIWIGSWDSLTSLMGEYRFPRALVAVMVVISG